MPLTRQEALTDFRKRYPMYGDMPDDQLAANIAETFPQYRDLLQPRGVYSTYIGQPLTSATAKVLDVLASPYPNVMAPTSPAAKSIAEFLVPQTTMEAGAMGAVPPARWAMKSIPLISKFPAALQRIMGGTIGGEAGGQISGEPTGKGAAFGGGATALGESVIGLGGKLLRSLPGVKGYVNEQRAQEMMDLLEEISPTLKAAVEKQRLAVSPTLKSGATAAALQETALGVSGKEALSDVMERGMLETTLAAQGQKIYSPALETVWRMLPSRGELARRLKADLAPDPTSGFAISQAERLLMELGNAAYKGEAGSPLARGVSGLELRKLYEKAIQEAESSLPGIAGDIFRGARREFSGGNAVLEMLREHPAFQGLPNRIFANTGALQNYMSQNRAELRSKLGPKNFDALWESLGQGGQLGTRDIAVPGAGTSATALQQVYGRGQGGAPQIAGSALRTVAPNIGAEYTGRAPFTVAPSTQALLDLIFQRGAAKALEP